MANGLRDALDAAWGDFPTNDVGYDWKRYTGNARPDQAWCDAVTQHSRLTFIMETYSQRSQEGAPAGSMDCLFAEQRARDRFPGVASIAVCVSDGNSADDWDASAYGADWARVATVAFYPYGTPSICASFCRGANSSLCLMGDWVPATWGETRAPMTRLVTQVVGYSPIANTDLNEVWAPYYPVGPAPTPTPGDDDVDRVLYRTVDDGHETYYREVEGKGVLIALKPEEAVPYLQGVTEGWIKVVTLGGFLSALRFSVNSINGVEQAEKVAAAQPPA